MASLFNVEEGRGMCVVNTSRRDNRACRDMCDYNFSPMSYTEGAARGAADIVGQVRGSGRCPNPHWWIWVILGALVCICCCACVIAALGKQIQAARNGGKGKKTMRATTLQGVASRGVDDAEDGGYEEEGRYAPAGTESEDQKDRDINLGMHYEDRAPEENIYAQGPPPEPPSQQHSSYREAPPPAPPPFPEDTHMSANQLFDAIDTNHDGVISRQEYEQFQRAASMGAVPPPPMAPGSAPPSIGSMRIPGLDEPNLFNNLQNMVGPGSAPQLAPPPMEGLGITTPFIQPQGGSTQVPVFQVAPSYHTQIPPTFATQLPPGPASAPNSVQMSPGAVTAGNAGAPFFTQLMRR
jgi:hypothetical protein